MARFSVLSAGSSHADLQALDSTQNQSKNVSSNAIAWKHARFHCVCVAIELVPVGMHMIVLSVEL